jgi:N-ethylmaleimide reductase
MNHKILVTPYQSEFLNFPNRFVMAPLTRQRAYDENSLTAFNALYYAQRSTAGLIVSEASPISAQGLGYANTPGIFTKKQIAGWKLATDAVHQAGGHIFIQLWHVGRHSHPILQEDGKLPVAPSALAENGHVTTPQGKMEPVVPHALTVDEIKDIIADYRQAALNSVETKVIFSMVKN